MNDPISPAMQQLYEEHGTILEMVHRMQGLLESADLSNRAAEAHRFISFFREYGDGYHHAKEEEVLFPKLMRAVPSAASLIESLEEHHAMFREELSRAEKALVNEDWLLATETLKAYGSMLRDHIGAEDDELFVLADEVFDDVQKEEMMYLFADRDRERGDNRKHELEADATS